MTEPSKALAQLTDTAQDDPGNPFFWETVYALAKQGKDIANPAAWVPWDLESYQACQPMEADLVGASLRDQIMDLKRRAVIHTPTQALPILDLPTQATPTIFNEWSNVTVGTVPLASHGSFSRPQGGTVARPPASGGFGTFRAPVSG